MCPRWLRKWPASCGKRNRYRWIVECQSSREGQLHTVWSVCKIVHQTTIVQSNPQLNWWFKWFWKIWHFQGHLGYKWTILSRTNIQKRQCCHLIYYFVDTLWQRSHESWWLCCFRLHFNHQYSSVRDESSTAHSLLPTWWWLLHQLYNQLDKIVKRTFSSTLPLPLSSLKYTDAVSPDTSESETTLASCLTPLSVALWCLLQQ